MSPADKSKQDILLLQIGAWANVVIFDTRDANIQENNNQEASEKQLESSKAPSGREFSPCMARYLNESVKTQHWTAVANSENNGTALTSLSRKTTKQCDLREQV